MKLPILSFILVATFAVDVDTPENTATALRNIKGLPMKIKPHGKDKS